VTLRTDLENLEMATTNVQALDAHIKPVGTDSHVS
jgi:hypothetical protein